jgi:hypothetical protein
MNACVEHWWNDIDRVKMKCQNLNPFNCYFISQKSHVDSPWNKPGPPHWEANDQQPEVKKGKGLPQQAEMAQGVPVG